MRIALALKYDGSQYHGWQFQNNVVTVQETLQNALHKILRDEISVTGCGRTDTGVHAKHFIAHFEHSEVLTSDFRFRLNNVLPKDISIDAVYVVPSNFNARFDATARTYRYYISTVKDPFSRNYAMTFFRTLDVEAMNKACRLLKNHTEFGAFCKSHTQNKTNICDVTIAEWEQQGTQLVFTIKANRFLRNMVRAIVGTMLEVGENKITLQEFDDIIASQNRQRAGYSVPAQGLFLEEVAYDKSDWQKVEPK